MFDLLSVASPLLVAAVLISSGVAKLWRPDDLAGWDQLGVPKPLQRRWLLRLHPWGEIALGAALIAFGGVLGALAAAVAFVLMGAYLILIWKILRAGADTSCACFGERKPVTGMTLARNWWYLLLSAVALAFGWVNPLWGGPLAAFGSVGWEWMVVLVAVAVTVVLTMWPQQETPVTVEAPAAGPDDGEPLDYVRTRTPSVPVTLADGTEVSLRALSMTQPILLLAVNPGCAPCAEVMARLPEWRALLPQVSVRLLLTLKPEVSAHAEHAEPQSLHDPYHFVRDSIADWATPTAVLLGADGMLAGGPVTGYRAISVFVDDIYESLNGERPTR